jgi:NAD(P)-dependent dehydrogenase (short-subunit alcohol dehydrogenase family)
VDLGFADATAVVTGGSKGMGRAVAEVLAADGARVAVMARGREPSTRPSLPCGLWAVPTPSASAWT